MQDFIVDDEPRARSIGFDATDRQGTIVTVGVLVNRTQEAMLLGTLYEELSEHYYLPFRTKSRDLTLPPEKIHEVLLQCNGEVGICIHQGDVTLPYAEAVHSAILLKELSVTTNDTVAIVDGDGSRANQLYQSSSGIDVVPPAIANCTQSELYYPHLLLADLVAGSIADRINENPGAASEVTLNDPVTMIRNTTSSTQDGAWGRGYSSVARQEGEVENPTFEQRYASSFRERIACWFRGQFGDRNADPPTSDGISHVVGRLEALGCEGIATWMIEQ
ncbi:hypothetical protein DMJ13_22940 [halophilic archaeon]|nr:hypothetical protein DMJ13_22940 [halophilic archaeon]